MGNRFAYQQVTGEERVMPKVHSETFLDLTWPEDQGTGRSVLRSVAATFAANRGLRRQ